MIKSLPFSFVKFEHPADNDYSLDIPYTLPVWETHDIAFQFVVGEDRPLTAGISLGVADTLGVRLATLPVQATVASYRYPLTGLSGHPPFFLSYIRIGTVVVNYNRQNTTPADLVQVLLDDYGIEVADDAIVLPSNIEVSIYAFTSAGPLTPFGGTRTPVWHAGYVQAAGLPVMQTDCFTYCLLNADNTVLGYSNTFKPAEEEPFTSLVTYSCKEDAYGFVYATGQQNTVRLPFFLRAPAYPKKRDVMRGSGGRNRVLSSLVEKEYTLDTEQMPEAFHEAMAIMLAHDDVVIENTNIREPAVSVIEADNYTAQWDDSLLPFAPGRVRVKVASFSYENSNC